MINKNTKIDFLRTLAFSIVAGVFVGMFDIWAFEMSLKFFLGGIFAGVTLFIPYTVISYFWPGLWFLRMLSWVLSGGIAGFVWWLVIKPQNISIWIPIGIGLILEIWWWLHEKPSKGSKGFPEKK